MAVKKKAARKTTGVALQSARRETAPKKGAARKVVPKAAPKKKTAAAKKATRTATVATKTARKPAAKRAAERRNRAQPESLRLRQTRVSLTCDNLEASVAFYADILGFTRGEAYRKDDGTLQGIELKAGAVTFYLSQDDWGKGRDRQKGAGFRIYFVTVQDIDALSARLSAKGLAAPVADTPWGTREISVSDPSGFNVTIAWEKDA